MTRCPSCGAEGEYQFCMYCGTELEAPEPVPPAHRPEPVQRPVQTHAQQRPVQTHAQPQPHGGQPYPPPYATTYVEPEPTVGWWKLVLGVVLLVVSLVIYFGFFIGIGMIVWFVVDWLKWRQWSERRGHYRYS